MKGMIMELSCDWGGLSGLHEFRVRIQLLVTGTGVRSEGVGSLLGMSLSFQEDLLGV